MVANGTGDCTRSKLQHRDVCSHSQFLRLAVLSMLTSLCLCASLPTFQHSSSSCRSLFLPASSPTSPVKCSLSVAFPLRQLGGDFHPFDFSLLLPVLLGPASVHDLHEPTPVNPSQGGLHLPQATSAHVQKHFWFLLQPSWRCVCGRGKGDEGGAGKWWWWCGADLCVTRGGVCPAMRTLAPNSGGRTPGSKLPASPPPLPRPDGGGQPWPCICVHGPKKKPHELTIAMMSSTTP